MSDAERTPGAAIYDATKSGNTNVGHSRRVFNGPIDWKCETGKLNDLLDYLKTL